MDEWISKKKYIHTYTYCFEKAGNSDVHYMLDEF